MKKIIVFMLCILLTSCNKNNDIIVSDNDGNMICIDGGYVIVSVNKKYTDSNCIITFEYTKKDLDN